MLLPNRLVDPLLPAPPNRDVPAAVFVEPEGAVAADPALPVFEAPNALVPAPAPKGLPELLFWLFEPKLNPEFPLLDENIADSIEVYDCELLM